MGKIEPLADDFVTVYESPEPDRVYCYSPGIARLPTGRLVASLDLGGPGVAELPGPRHVRGDRGRSWQGRIFTSDDHGQSWEHRIDFPFMHARPFVAGDSLYVLGHAGDLAIMRSNDRGETWSEPAALTEGQSWHQAPCNVHYANGCVYLVMERRAHDDVKAWAVSALAPVLMRGKIDDDLAQADNWAFASELPFRDTVPANELDWFGVPFYSTPPKESADVGGGRHCAPIGWLETNVVQFVDPDHIWHDPEGRTFHLWMRAHTGTTNMAAVARVVEHEDGSMTTMLQTTPSGRKMVYVPCPGGQMKFHLLFDEPTGLFWLLSTQSTDSMTRAEMLGDDRYNLPSNQRSRLQLHFSKNCIDWCFAGIVAIGPGERASRHYASMVIDGEDLQVLSRSGSPEVRNTGSPHRDAHDTNMITFHTVENFRELIY